MSIRVLPPHVADKIAAGEVVERPASVLKELVENSLDAGATAIEVVTVSGGRKLVSVTDNGSGMNRDDALLCFERYATSKIKEVEDIERIGTLGFRGEALAAICSVSRFTLLTCRPGDLLGTQITISGGKLLDVKETGCPPGARVEVRDLFFNVPVRRKFLRSPQTEQSHIRDVFIVQALAHPAVSMTLTVDGVRTHELPGNAGLDARIRELFGRSCLDGFRPVAFESAGVRVSGYAGEPVRSRTDRNEQFVFVNNRPVNAPILSRSIREAYRSLLPGDRHPRVVLFIALDPGLVDVNVHPTKREVRFRDPSSVRDIAIEAVRRVFASVSFSGVAVGQEERPAVPDVPSVVETEQRLRIEDLPESAVFKYPRMPMEAGAHPVKPGRSETSVLSPAPAGENTASTAGERKDSSAGESPWAWCRVLGHVGGLYVVLETEDGFALMDPHAAHERVMFERFMKEVAANKVESQALLIPETVELNPGDARCARRNLDLMKKMGFGVSEFGADSFVVDSLPACFSGVSPATLLADIAGTLDGAATRGGDAAVRQEQIAQAACKAAVKGTSKLALREIEELLVSLAGTEMPYTCPHGRPTLIFTSFKELNRRFGRE